MSPRYWSLVAILLAGGAQAQTSAGATSPGAAPTAGQAAGPTAQPAGPPTPPDLARSNAASGPASAPAPDASVGVAAGLPALASVDATLDRVPSVIAAAARLDSARAHARQLAVGPYEVTGEVTYDRRSIRSTNRGVNEVNLIANRAFRLPGKAALDRSAGRYEVIAAQNNYADARHQVALALASAWFDLVAANERATLLQRTVDEQRRLFAAVGLRVGYKDAARLDADRAQLELDLAQAQLASALSDLARARSILSGTYPTLVDQVVPPTTVLLQPDTATLQAWRDRILLDSHELRAAQAEYDRQNALARRASLDRFADPTIGARAFTEQGGDEKGVGVQLSVPFGGRYRAAKTQQAEADAREAAANLATVHRQVQVTADADLADARGQLAAYAIASRAVGAARTASARLEQGYRLGGVDLADLLYARRQQRDAEITEADFRAKAARAVTKLRIDSHILWAAPDPDD